MGEVLSEVVVGGKWCAIAEGVEVRFSDKEVVLGLSEG